MLDGLNKFGLPVKYGVIGFLGCPVGMLLASILGITSGSTSYMMAAIAGGVGGAVGGWFRQRKGDPDNTR
ncbi:MAG: hypothetical protein JRC69_02015 [Deltaproteobacteria bacterium]|nr:hypothetical protein [Deltaproteobacteria bacterium]